MPFSIMEFLNYTFDQYPSCSVQVSAFTPVKNGSEYHMIFQIREPGRRQLHKQQEESTDILHYCVQEFLSREPYNKAQHIFARYFLKNAKDQRPRIHTRKIFPASCAISCIEQPPANGSQIALWIYLRDPGTDTEQYTHYWITERYCLAGDVTGQTLKLLTDYEKWLLAKGCSMAENCLRTWFYIQDIDTNYAAFAKARTDYFRKIGLNEETHYIASTGIEGSNGTDSSLVTMDAYAVVGLDASRIKYLHGLSHLSPTNIYGVTFERGVALTFDDRRQILISGTASIDKSGNVLHINDIQAQSLRMIENVEILLAEAEATFEDVAQIIVYLRRKEDYQLVLDLFASRFPAIPTVIVMGKVCRPTWLIEMECIALT
ncbi:MAG: Rid family hydrolase [Bacteroidales bacterium]